MSSTPATPSVQFYSREGTSVAMAQQKAIGSSVSSSSVTAVTESIVPVTSGTTASFQLNADTLQLIGMPGQLPSSNLVTLNYPHTKWERDAEGNMIPIQVRISLILEINTTK